MSALRFRGCFPCSPTGARRARKLLTNFAKAWFRDSDLVHFELASGEALANCVEHGGGPKLSIDCWLDGGRLITEIRHEGRGFEPPARISAPPQGSARGYGLFIMHSLLDAVEYLDGGTGLRLVKKLRA